MNKFVKYAFCSLFPILTLQGAYNDPCFEGINLHWEDKMGTEERLKIIAKFLPKNPIIFEAGANDGTDTFKLAEKWPEGKVYAFEPNPNQFNKLVELTKGNKNIHCFNLALNVYNGTATFYLCWGTGGTDPTFEGASSLLQPTEEMKIHYMGPEIEVPCMVLDDWCIENHVLKFDFMWLDMEGFELQVLSSSLDILDTVKVIYTETNLYKFRKGCTQFSDLKRFLSANGFRMVAHWYREGVQGDAIFVRKKR